MKRESMFQTRNIFTPIQEKYHNSLIGMKKETLSIYNGLGVPSPKVECDKDLNSTIIKCGCKTYDYVGEHLAKSILAIENTEVDFIVSCLTKNEYLHNDKMCIDLMSTMLMCLKVQMVDIESFVIYIDNKINDSQRSVVLLCDIDNIQSFNKMVANLEFLLSNSGITRCKIILKENYNPLDYCKPCKFDYNAFTNELSINPDDYTKEEKYE